MSRFAYLHQDNKQWVVESPLVSAKIVLHDWRATALLHALAKPQSLEELCSEFPEISKASVSMFLSLLLGANSVTLVSEHESVEEAQSLAQWEFHDLLFHSRSRLGRHANPYGATHRFLDKIEPLPAVKPPMSDKIINLYKPDINALKENDVPFIRVMEERCSIRQHGEPPLTAKQLGEFLYRTARVREIIEPQQHPYQSSNRPYPNGGACYELELYPIVNACEGLSSGLYHYSPNEHTIEKLTVRTSQVETLLKNAGYATSEQEMPQILIVLAARFQRVSWQYNSVAYALILKQVGILYQSMYLVAMAMGFAPCALGIGDADLFAAAVGTEYYVETSVGEFILGSRTNSR